MRRTRPWRSAVDEEMEAISHDPDRFDALLRRQNYRLAYWRTASEELDYRRFFNIDTLVGVRVEDPDVFDSTHRLVLELVADGTVDGLRVDHVDGLRDPGRLPRPTPRPQLRRVHRRREDPGAGRVTAATGRVRGDDRATTSCIA